MNTVKAQLDRFKNNNRELEMELRSEPPPFKYPYSLLILFFSHLGNSIAETKARHLEARLQENHLQIDNLRSEREMLVRDHQSLQKKFAEITEVSSSVPYYDADK